MQYDLRIRPAVDGDLDCVAAVWHESASRMDGCREDMPSCFELRRRVALELAAGWVLYVAQRGDEIVGILAIKPGEAWLDQVFVLPNAQRQGVGGALLDTAKRAMPGGFSLRAASSNARAGRFYQNEGMTVFHESLHPRSGAPVCYYEWKADDGPRMSEPAVRFE